jgi:hypothetical protein
MAVLVCASVVLLLGSPVALYWLGLSAIEGRPTKPTQIASVEQQSLVWKRAHGEGEPRVEADNPYAYLASILSSQRQRTPPGQLVTWWVASDYLAKQEGHKGMGWWHLSGAALSIWLSRNWTSEEILSAAARSRQSASDAVHCTAAHGQEGHPRMPKPPEKIMERQTMMEPFDPPAGFQFLPFKIGYRNLSRSHPD